jgi:hypothetical protein
MKEEISLVRSDIAYLMKNEGLSSHRRERLKGQKSKITELSRHGKKAGEVAQALGLKEFVVR